MWIARDKNGRLYFYIAKPVKAISGDYWRSSIPSVPIYNEDENKFSDVKWTDKEPTEVELVKKE